MIFDEISATILIELQRKSRLHFGWYSNPLFSKSIKYFYWDFVRIKVWLYSRISAWFRGVLFSSPNHVIIPRYQFWYHLAKWFWHCIELVCGETGHCHWLQNDACTPANGCYNWCWSWNPKLWKTLHKLRLWSIVSIKVSVLWLVIKFLRIWINRMLPTALIMVISVLIQIRVLGQNPNPKRRRTGVIL